jgi:myo-inositol-1(or 4)-monophosphatase
MQYFTFQLPAWPLDAITVAFAARVIDAVRAAAADEIVPRFRSVTGSNPAGASQPRRKDDGTLVTEADLGAQRTLIRRLAALDDAPVLGEEMAAAEQQAIWASEGRFWCVDPLDGTSNFSNGIAFFAISVALMESLRPVLGIVYDPIADEAFYAVRGAGAWLNHRPLASSSHGPAMDAAVAEVSVHRNPRLRSALTHRRPYGKRLTSGSSALSWCHLAAGRIDAYLHTGQMAWDFSAGALVLAEAGGLCATFDNDDFWDTKDFRRSVIAARTAALFHEWKRWIRENA